MTNNTTADGTSPRLLDLIGHFEAGEYDEARDIAKELKAATMRRGVGAGIRWKGLKVIRVELDAICVLIDGEPVRFAIGSGLV